MGTLGISANRGGSIEPAVANVLVVIYGDSMAAVWREPDLKDRPDSGVYAA